MIPSSTDVAAVAIGRNEGTRLVACLTALTQQVTRVVYVDSGSSDGSVQAALNLGVTVVELDPHQPFTAARARNAGFEALRDTHGADALPEFVQFIDGDCTLDPDWIAAATQALHERPDVAIVTGWRSEIHPDASIYNALVDFEWHRPAGEITACGGDMMVRRTDFQTVGGFNPVVIAAEDDEFCTRIRKTGRKIIRLPLAMTRHDAAMMRFGQWWQRAVRSGHGFAQVGDIHPEYFQPEKRRVILFGALLPTLALFFLIVAPWMLLAVLSLYAISYFRTVQGLMRANLPPQKARHQALFLSLSKFPNLLGMIRYYKRKARGHAMRIIEYK